MSKLIPRLARKSFDAVDNARRAVDPMLARKGAVRAAVRWERSKHV
jgi:hypothetical protein